MNNIPTKTDVKPLLGKMVKEGKYEANFGQLTNAKYFAGLLDHKGLQTKIDEILGHATTVDTHPSVRLDSHFHVKGMKVTYTGSGAAHRVLGKFV